MNLRVALTVLASAFLFVAGNQAQSPLAVGKPSSVPVQNPFQNWLVQPSAPWQFLVSPQGRHILRMGTHPLSKTLLKWMGEDTTRVPELVRSRRSLPRTLPPGDPAFGAGCTPATGSVFNLEPAGGDPNTGLNFPLP